MSANFWQRIHGGSTHFPIVLLLASVAFDLVAWRTRDEPLRRGLHAAGFGSAVVGLLGGLGAVVAGLMMTHGRMLGGGSERIHHLFVWPAFVMSVVLVGWRLFRHGRIPQRGLALYFVGMGLVSALMVGAGYSGGEMLLGSETGGEPAPTEDSALGGARLPEGQPPIVSASGQSAIITVGRQLYLKNCAHCHGADGRGDEGPDLHDLDSTDEQIAKRIRNGKKGQMTAFAGKLSADDIRDVIIYLHTLEK